MRRIRLGLALGCLAGLACACSLPSIPGDDAGEDVLPPRDIFEPPDNYVAGDGDAPGFAITSVEPSRGPIAGGTRIAISGAGFLAGSTLVVGSTQAAEVVVQNDASILATTPAHPAGWVDVLVQRPDGKTARLANGFFYEATIVVSAVEPAEGPQGGGTPITVRGSGFSTDSHLLVGGRQAQDVRVLDAGTLLALTPPGTPGPRDVTIANDSGIGSLRRGFRYAATPAVARCEPPVVADGTAIQVTVRGEGLDDGTFAFSAGGAVALEAASATEARFRFTPDGPGPVSVSFQGTGGRSTREACLFVATPGELEDWTPRVLAVTPASGDAAGGDAVTALVLGFEGATPDSISVEVGGAPAPSAALADNGREVAFVTPAGAVGPADVAVDGLQGRATAAAAFRYLPHVALESVLPASGPAGGGTRVLVRGTGLSQVREVFVGPLPAVVVAGPSDSAVEVLTAPSSPGRQDVAVVTGAGRRIVLPGAFVFGATAPELVAITPDTGSQAGGTRVSVAGSGFAPGMTVLFDNVVATVLDDTDPARLVVLTPRAFQAGRVDVSVMWPDGLVRTKRQAFGYFDPTGFFGGVWGDAVNGAVNVTVLDAYNGKPVVEAFVILGHETDTPFKGWTDLRGQVTLSGEDLFGPVQATASRGDYSTTSLVGVDAENLTMTISPLNPQSSGGGTPGTTLPPGIITGHVAGADKYLLAPPDSCANRSLVHGTLCTPCSADAECGAGSTCATVAGGGSHCASSCTAQEDCPDGYACYSLGNGATGCLPAPGRPEVQCATSVRSPFSSAKSTAPGSRADGNGLFSLGARIGEVAVYCIGGLRRFEDGRFDPVAMGIRRHVPVSSARITADMDMDLSIPLDRDVDIRLVNAPGGPSGPNDHQVLVALDLGSDGVLRLWSTLAQVDGERFVLEHLPRDFAGDLEGAVLYVYAEADSRTSDTVPYSTSMIPDWTPGRNLGVVQVAGSDARMLAPDQTPDATGGCALPSGDGLVLGRAGRAWTLTSGGAVEGRASLGRATFRACSARGDAVLAVGDGGSVTRTGPDFTVAEAAPGASTLRAVTWLPDGTAWAAGDGTLLHRDAAGSWTRMDYGSLAPLYGLVAQPDGTAWAVGAKGLVVRLQDTTATPVAPGPADTDLLAGTTLNGLPLIVGSGGLALLGDGSGAFTRLPTPTTDDLLAVLALADGTALAAGARGTIVRLSGGAFQAVATGGFDGELTTLLPGADGTALAVAGDAIVVGPFLRIATFRHPLDGLPWTDLAFSFTRDGPPAPSVTYTTIYGSKAGVGEWVVAAEGGITSIRLPDLRAASAGGSSTLPLVGMPSGDIIVRTVQILIDGFDMNAYDEEGLYSSEWRSWSVSATRPKR